MASVTEKPLSQAIRERRATPHFRHTAVPDQDIGRILEAGRQAPSGYNLQPWRFVVVRDDDNKKRLQRAAMGQPKVAEASAVIVACGDPEGWKKGDLDEMLRLALRHGYGTAPEHENVRKTIESFLGGGRNGGLGIDLTAWVNRHVMIAFTHMMLMAEALGYDTAPMEGFHEEQVKEVLKIPASIRVVALLAVGRLDGPDKAYAGRFDPSRLFFEESWGRSLGPSGRSEEPEDEAGEKETEITAAGETGHESEARQK